MITFKRRHIFKFICASILFLLVASRAQGDATLLLEEPFGGFGDMNPTGHAAIYLDRVCAASPTELRPCEPGEQGVVISRYHRIGGYDWIAIPLIPYLYAVDDPRNIPTTIDAEQEMQLRNRYRREHLLSVAPDVPGREIPGGEWIQLIGSSYDRRIYGFQIETSERQDRALIETLNRRRNKSHFNLFFNNCANFAESILNFYYPHSIHRNFIADAGLMTPKQAARSLVRYSKHHRDLQFKTIVFPQVQGTIHRSDPVDGVIESLVKSKKYVLPIAILHPFVAGGLAVAYLGDGRFHLDPHAQVFDPARFAEALEASAKEPVSSAGDGATTAQPTSFASGASGMHATPDR